MMGSKAFAGTMGQSRSACLQVVRRLRSPILATFIVAALWAFVLTPAAHAWKAAGHWVLADQVSRQLPVGNVIRTAMERQPAMWAWGSFGPDLGYGTSETVSQGWAPWADRYHYRKAGTMAKRMLQSALASGSEHQIAFAAGWLTHVIGDFTCHSMYVNPEAGGAFFAEEGTIPKHRDLEKYADPYIWADIGGRPSSAYRAWPDGSFYQNYSAYPDWYVRELMAFVSREVYGESLSNDSVSSFIDFIFGQMKFGGDDTSGIYLDHTAALAQMAHMQPDGRTRAQNIDRALSVGTAQCVRLLQDAARGDYSWYSDVWNLDLGQIRQPLGCFEVTIGTKAGSPLDTWGTNDDVFFYFDTWDGGHFEYLLDHRDTTTPGYPVLGEYDDFEMGDNDDYYIYAADPRLRPSNIMHVGLRKAPGNDWMPVELTVRLNGHVIGSWTPTTTPGLRQFDDSHLTWAADVAWGEYESGTAIQLAGDWNGDGSVDLGQLWPNTWADLSFWLWTSERGQLTASAAGRSGEVWLRRATKAVSGDFDKDGKDEVGIFYDYGGAKVDPADSPYVNALWLWDVVDGKLSWRRVWHAHAEGWSSWTGSIYQAGDYDGDGRDEIAAYRFDGDHMTATVTRMKYTDTAMTATAVWSGRGWPQTVRTAAADVDRDGKDELCLLRDAGNNSVAWYVLDAEGTGATPLLVWTSAPTWSYDLCKVEAGDWDGDGKDDLAVFYKWADQAQDAGAELFTFDVVKAASGTTLSKRWENPAAWWSWDLTRLTSGDLDGEGKDELVGFYDYPWQSGHDQGIWIWRPDRAESDPGFLTRPWLKTSWEWEPELLNSVRSDWIDKTPPVAALAAPAWAGATGKISWSARDERFGSGVDAYRFAWRDQTMGDWAYDDWAGQTSRTMIVPVGATTLDLAVSARDKAGNVSPWTYAKLKIDRVPPVTRAAAAGVTAGGRAMLKFRVNDAAPSCGKAVVKIQIRRRTTVLKTILVGTRATNTALTYRYTAKLKRGVYNWRVLATDVAGNIAAKRVAATLTVR